MKAFRLILMLFAVACLIIGFVWQSEEKFSFNLGGSAYIAPQKFIFFAIAIVAAILYLLLSLKDVIRKK